MLRYEDSAEEVTKGERFTTGVPVRRGKAAPAANPARLKSDKAKTVKARRSQDPLGPDAKNYNDEIPDPDLVIPE